eukprot:gene5363-6692_t
MYSRWSRDDLEYAKRHKLNQQFSDTYIKFKGLRLIRQDPLECLMSFICSQNNNITRISKMVNQLKSNYGTKIGTYRNDDFYAFPTLEQLQTIKESSLNELGFGYRSKFIVKSSGMIKEKGGNTWLNSLRLKNHNESHTELTSLMGVGQKVADCVCLFSLDKLDIVPIDTHIFNITKKHVPSLSKSKLSKSIYNEIRQCWKDSFGEYAGWGHTLLFANEISFFKQTNSTKTSTGDKRKLEEESEEKEKEDEEEEKEESEKPKTKKTSKKKTKK